MANSSPRARRLRRVHKSPPKLDEVRNEINVTPLVDICLVLLIIFMVIGPMLQRGKEIELPTTSYHRNPIDSREPIVAVDEDGQIYVEKTKVKNLEEMEKAVKDQQEALILENNRLVAAGDTDALLVRAGEIRVLVKGHPSLTYKDVRPVIMRLNKMGVPEISVGTNEAKDKE